MLKQSGSELAEGFLQAIYVGLSNSTVFIPRTTYKRPGLFVWFPVKYWTQPVFPAAERDANLKGLIQKNN